MAVRRKVAPRERTYDVIREAVTSGVAYGYRHAHKYGAPTDAHIRDTIVSAVLSELCEALTWEGDGGP